MSIPEIQELLALVDHSLILREGQVEITNRARLQETVSRLVEVSALETGVRQSAARFIVRSAALDFGAIPASIHDLYIARGRGEIPNNFTVPAMNLRMLSFETARAVFRTAMQMNAGAFIFEIARSEMGYTDQPPAEYVTNILAAAIAEGYTGPVFIQGDHFQVSAKRYSNNPEAELQAIQALCKEAIQAGFYNIDIDTSTLVDISKPTVAEQQKQNSSLSALFTAFIRSIEPEGITVSIGGEIGEVGGYNSTEEELRNYMDQYIAELDQIKPGTPGLSKISIQTGTSHGGVVMPDGSIAQVAVDFDTLLKLSRLSRQVYKAGGAVQHGASTLPEDAFGKFVDSEALEVHLATNFQNIAFNHLPESLVAEMYAYLDEKHANERKTDMTDEQFYYKTRKYVLGPFKPKLMKMDQVTQSKIGKALEDQFVKLFNSLNMKETRSFVDATIRPISVQPDLQIYLGDAIIAGDVSDLAD
jgi:fructose/tagatose bisphosphate aldolase